MDITQFLSSKNQGLAAKPKAEIHTKSSGGFQCLVISAQGTHRQESGASFFSGNPTMPASNDGAAKPEPSFMRALTSKVTGEVVGSVETMIFFAANRAAGDGYILRSNAVITNTSQLGDEKTDPENATSEVWLIISYLNSLYSMGDPHFRSTETVRRIVGTLKLLLTKMEAITEVLTPGQFQVTLAEICEQKEKMNIDLMKLVIAKLNSPFLKGGSKTIWETMNEETPLAALQTFVKQVLQLPVSYVTPVQAKSQYTAGILDLAGDVPRAIESAINFKIDGSKCQLPTLPGMERAEVKAATFAEGGGSTGRKISRDSERVPPAEATAPTNDAKKNDRVAQSWPDKDWWKSNFPKLDQDDLEEMRPPLTGWKLKRNSNGAKLYYKAAVSALPKGTVLVKQEQ